MKKAITATFAITLLIATYATVYSPAEAQIFAAITINPNGTITPPTAPITQNQNTYTLTANIYGNITIQKSNIIFDGATNTIYYDKDQWYALLLDQVCNVTVKNVVITGTYMGLHLNYTDNSTITNNTISNNRADGIFIYGKCSGNTIAGNIVTNTTRGAGIGSTLYAPSRNNTIIENKVIGNQWGIQINTATSEGITVTENQIESNKIGINFGPVTLFMSQIHFMQITESTTTISSTTLKTLQIQP